MFDESTIRKLNEPLPKELVKTREGANKQKLSYVPGFFVIQQANELFGHGNWNSEIIDIKKTHDAVETKVKNQKEYEQYSVAYLAHIKLTVKNGHDVCVHEDIGFGDGTASNTSYGVRSSIELATKEAATDGLKRCLRKFGDQFGLSLYDKDATPMSTEEIEESRTIDESEIKALRELYEARGIDDKWVLAAIEPQGYTGTIEEMNVSWYQYALKITTDYKLDEIQKAKFEADYTKKLDLMEQSVTIPMLQGIFREIYGTAKKHDDKNKMREAKAVYDETKAKLEEKQ